MKSILSSALQEWNRDLLRWVILSWSRILRRILGWAKAAREGQMILWVIDGGHYVGQIVDGRYHNLGRG